MPYGTSDWWRAVLLSAFLGWAFVVGEGALQRGDLLMVPIQALFGLPVAFLTTLLIGGPILGRIMRQTVSWRRAVLWGAGIAALMAAISILLGRLNGYRISQSSTFSFQIGYGDYLREKDGVLTLYGWQVLAQNTAIFIAIGAMVGLLVRAAIGPGRR